MQTLLTILVMLFCAQAFADDSKGCHAETVTGIDFTANRAKPNVQGQYKTGIMRGVNFKTGTKLSSPPGSNVFVYSHCLGGPTGVGTTKWTDLHKWNATEKREVVKMASDCGMKDIFGKDMNRWLGPEGIKCAAKNFIAYAKENPHVRVHFECDNMTYAKKNFGGKEVNGYKMFVDEIKAAGICNAAIVPKNLKNAEYLEARKLDPTRMSNVGARETDARKPPRCERVGDMIISQNADADTGAYKLDAGPESCGQPPTAQPPVVASVVRSPSAEEPPPVPAIVEIGAEDGMR